MLLPPGEWSVPIIFPVRLKKLIHKNLINVICTQESVVYHHFSGQGISLQQANYQTETKIFYVQDTLLAP